MEELCWGLDILTWDRALNSIFTQFSEILNVPKAPTYLIIPFMNSKYNNSLKTELSVLIGKYYP